MRTPLFPNGPLLGARNIRRSTSAALKVHFGTLAKTFHVRAHLRGCIVSLPRVTDEPYNGRDVDDATGTLLEHHLRRCLRAVENPTQVKVDHLAGAREDNVPGAKILRHRSEIRMTRYFRSVTASDAEILRPFPHDARTCCHCSGFIRIVRVSRVIPALLTTTYDVQGVVRRFNFREACSDQRANDCVAEDIQVSTKAGLGGARDLVRTH